MAPCEPSKRKRTLFREPLYALDTLVLAVARWPPWSRCRPCTAARRKRKIRCRRARSCGSIRSFDKLLPKDANVETIARGFIWTEGTAWNKDGKFLVFSDIPNNVVHKWQDGKGIPIRQAVRLHRQDAARRQAGR